jgi:hypothetical protein
MLFGFSPPNMPEALLNSHVSRNVGRVESRSLIFLISHVVMQNQQRAEKA